MNTKEKLESIIDLRDIIADASSISEVLYRCNIKRSTTNYKVFEQYILENNIVLNLAPRRKTSEIPTKDRLVENSDVCRGVIKRFIIKNQLKHYSCEWCGIADEWNNKKLVLVLDHINGVNTDNRLDNLRFLCPNCNSQTETFTSKNKEKKPRKSQYIICLCGNKMCKTSTRCQKCYNDGRVSDELKSLDKQDLIEMFKNKSMIRIAQELGISQKQLRKYKKLYIETNKYTGEING